MDSQQKNTLDRLLKDDVIDLRQYWRTISRRKWSILGFALVVTLLAAMVVFSMEPVYRATATLLIESKQAKVVSIEEVYGLDGGNNEYYLTQFEILKSRKLSEKVIQRYSLLDHPEFNREPTFDFNWRKIAGDYIPELKPGEPTVEGRYQALVNAFSSRVTVSPVRKTQLVKITFEAYSPEFAAKMANALGEAYIENNLEAKLELTVKASSWLNERLGGLKDKLRESEARLQAFRDSEQIVGDNGGLDIVGNELDLLADKLVDARRDRLELENVYRQVQRAGGKADPSAYERIPAVLQHPLVQSYKSSLSEAERKVSELAKRYGPKHPKMVAAQSDVASAKQALYRQINSVISGIKNQYQVSRDSEVALERSLGNTKGELQELGRKEYRLKELQQEVDVNRQLYDTFFTRLNETAATGDLESANARISDPAVAPLGPAKPKKKLIIALSFVVSTLFGVMMAFLLEALNNTVRSSGDIETKLGMPVLGLLPLLKSSRKNRHPSYNQYLDDSQSGFSESVRTIRTGLMLSSLDNPHKVVAVTSTVPGEGKTSSALSLAFSLGQMEKVLLIDADMRRPSIARQFDCAGRQGLSELVAGTCTESEAVFHSEAHGIDLLPAGQIPPNPLELLSSKRFAAVLAELEKHYDRIVIDTAPCQAVSDALVLAPLVGAVVYVVKSDATPTPQVQSGIKRLREVNAPLVGVILNQVNLKKASKYYGEGYSGYYDVYGYSNG
ncbi:GumC family protein [Marinobacterium jannaschii]|uniref:GumC family protein n=1 Tax=Marinobacterium jannaschii TaxID=64970 RepID=UPI000483F7AB|nr:polysaccharide biosynthesis tyrosine autokinase [Marinobacterium jannaschii]